MCGSMIVVRGIPKDFLGITMVQTSSVTVMGRGLLVPPERKRNVRCLFLFCFIVIHALNGKDFEATLPLRRLNLDTVFWYSGWGKVCGRGSVFNFVFMPPGGAVSAITKC